MEIHSSLALASSIGLTGMQDHGYRTHFRVSLQEGVRDPPVIINLMVTFRSYLETFKNI